MIVEAGLIIFFGMLFIFVKLPKRTALRLLGKPLALDLGVSVIVYVLHWGTFSGVMAAAFAGMMTSIFTSFARWLYGYVARVDGKWMYYPGKIYVDPKSLR